MLTHMLETQLHDHILLLEQTVKQSASVIADMAECISKCFRSGGKLLLCGNGGSAADAQHIAAEFVNRFRFDRGALPAVALTADSSIVTSIGNDSAFEFIFSRQVEAFARPGDILIGISTSGRSPNVLKALSIARAHQVTTIGFTGSGGQETMNSTCDYCLAVPSTDTARIQECHEFIWHVLCGVVEQSLFSPKHS